MSGDNGKELSYEEFCRNIEDRLYDFTREAKSYLQPSVGKLTRKKLLNNSAVRNAIFNELSRDGGLLSEKEETAEGAGMQGKIVVYVKYDSLEMMLARNNGIVNLEEKYATADNTLLSPNILHRHDFLPVNV